MLIGGFDFDFNCKKCFKVSLQRTRSETWQPFASARSRHLHKLTNHFHQHFVQVKLNNRLRKVRWVATCCKLAMTSTFGCFASGIYKRTFSGTKLLYVVFFLCFLFFVMLALLIEFYH